nr:4'-phosphopantetheinyl transferase superfamily protein [Microvirga terricola]
MSPDDLRFETAPSGKPFLSDGPFFNLSHSGDRILIAISQRFDLGLDIEHLTDAPDALSAALAEEDQKLLPSLSDSRGHAETILWSIKEAALKLTGEVMVDPRHLSVERRRGGGFRIVPARAAKAPLPEIFVHLIVMDDGYVAALATYEPTVTAKAALAWKSWPGLSSCASPAGQGLNPARQTVLRDSSPFAEMWPLCPIPSAA